MSTQFFLDETDVDTLINLLLRSQQSRTREALCYSIGIDPKRLSFIRDSSESDFFLLLIKYLNEIGEKEALCKLCCKELLPVFHQGKYATILSEIAAKLNCNQRLSQSSPNNQHPTVLSSSPAPSVSINLFNQLAKLVTGGVIFVIFLAGLSSYYHKPDNPTSTSTSTSTENGGYTTGNIACYSHNQEGSIRSIGGGIYLMGLIKLTGKYKGRIFEPKGYEGQDISAAQELKDLCNQTFPSAKGGGWAGGDTGGFVGIEPRSL